MKFTERLHTFIKPRFRHSDTYTLNILNTSLSAWSRYLAFLEIIHNRYAEVSPSYVDKMLQWHDALRQKAAESEQTGGRAFAVDNWEEMQVISGLGLQAHLEIESFYIFANILLDRIASTFRYYFWKKPNWNHMNLVANLARICANKPLTVTPPDLLEMPANLQQHIVEYRNKRIEHVEEPRFQFGSTWGHDRKMKIYPTLLYPSLSETQSTPETSGDVDQILTLLDKYATAMLDFFDTNADKSILPPEHQDEAGLVPEVAS